jgi:ketosteroid isomerase-like protein
MKAAVLVLLLLAPIADCVAANETAADESAIRATRERFNKAIEQQDVDAISPVFAQNYHIITGRSAQSHGADKEYQNWQQLFNNDPTFICRREPREIRTNSEWGLAEELGNWTCNYTVEGEPANATCVYAAKWQRSTDGTWLLQSEVFTTMTCTGSAGACQRPDPL